MVGSFFDAALDEVDDPEQFLSDADDLEPGSRGNFRCASIKVIVRQPHRKDIQSVKGVPEQS